MSGALPRLHVITSREVLTRPDFTRRAAAALTAAGQRCAIHLRGHGLPGAQLWALASRLRSSAPTAILWINDRVDLALALRADGVQLGARSLPVSAARRMVGRSAWIGQSVHDVEEAAACEADVAMLGAIYATESHPGQRPLGLGAVRRAAALRRPILGIGGITAERAAEVVEAGAWGVAVLSGVWDQDDPAEAVRRYLEGLESTSRSGLGAR